MQDLCSSGRLGGGYNGDHFFALKYNGGILTAEESPKEDYRAWGPGYRTVFLITG